MAQRQKEGRQPFIERRRGEMSTSTLYTQVDASLDSYPPPYFKQYNEKEKSRQLRNSMLSPIMPLVYENLPTNPPAYGTLPKNSKRSKWIMAAEKERKFQTLPRDNSYADSFGSSLFCSTPKSKNWAGETTLEDFIESARRNRLIRSRPGSLADDHERKDSLRNRQRSLETSLYNSQRAQQCEEDSEESNDEDNNFKRASENTHFRGFSSDEKYLIGTLRVPLAKLEAVVTRFPPPSNWKDLPRTERIAYVFHCALWSQYPIDFNAWHNSFNMEFYKMRLQHFTDEDALYEICSRMQAHYVEEKKKRFKEEGHLYGGVPEHVRNENQEKPQPKNFGPYKHSGFVSFARFAPDGRLLLIDSNKKGCFVALSRPAMLYGQKELQMLDHIQSFKGPLIDIATSPPHAVAFFIRRRIDYLRACHWEESLNDVLLLWQMLLLCVQHHGKVSGPDIATLLTQATDVEERSAEISFGSHRSIVAPIISPHRIFAQRSDSQNTYKQKMLLLLLQGQFEEALETAMRSGLTTEALLLVHRVAPHKTQEIHSRIMETFKCVDPLATLLSVSDGNSAPILDVTDSGTPIHWTPHMAIILANLSDRPQCAQSMRQFYQTMLSRGQLSAADFCRVVVVALGEVEKFNGVMLHGSLSNEGTNLCKQASIDCIWDLLATEIWAYASTLQQNETSSIDSSIEYQLKRIQFAQMLARCGFTKMAYRYCLQIARLIWDKYAEVPYEKLNLLCEVAESVMLSGGAGEEKIWVNQLRTMAEKLHGQSMIINSTSCHSDDEKRIGAGSLEEAMLYHKNNDRNTIDFEAARSPVSTECNIEQASSQPHHLTAVIESHELDPEVVRHSTPPRDDMLEKDAAFIESSKTSNVVGKPLRSPGLHSRSPRQGIDVDDSPPTTTRIYSETVQCTPAVSEYRTPLSNGPTPESSMQNMKAKMTPEKGRANKGIFDRLKDKLSRALPNGAPEMKLPDDSAKEIVWDATKGRYVGANNDDEVVNAKPPPLIMTPERTSIHKRTTVASRYRSIGVEAIPTVKPSPSSLGEFMGALDGKNNFTSNSLFIPQASTDTNNISPFTLQSPINDVSKGLHDHAE